MSLPDCEIYMRNMRTPYYLQDDEGLRGISYIVREDPEATEAKRSPIHIVAQIACSKRQLSGYDY